MIKKHRTVNTAIQLHAQPKPDSAVVHSVDSAAQIETLEHLDAWQRVRVRTGEQVYTGWIEVNEHA